MSKKIIALVVVSIITTTVSSGFALFNQDRYKTVLRKNTNLENSISKLSNQSEEQNKKFKESEGDISNLKETITILENKIIELEENKSTLEASIVSREQNYNNLKSKYDVLIEKIKGISNLTN